MWWFLPLKQARNDPSTISKVIQLNLIKKKQKPCRSLFFISLKLFFFLILRNVGSKGGFENYPKQQDLNPEFQMNQCGV